MALTEKVTQEDIILYEILRNPILCGEFYRDQDIPEWDTERWEYTEYQKEYLGDFGHYVSLCCGRAVGKTVVLTDYIIWILVNALFPNEYIVYTVPSKVHLEPVFFTLIKVLRNNILLKHYIEPKKGINSSNHTIRLMNASQLICRIAGQSGTGANIIGLHSPIIILDEAGYYPWGTWMELQPVLNSWQDGHKLFISGVPTGLRENNVLWHADSVDDKFNHHRTSAHENPRYTESDEERNLKQYGGVDGEDYVHMVLGRHGAASFAVFDRRMMKIESYPVYKTKINGLEESYTDIIGKLALLPPVTIEHDIKIMGIDTGYTEPTAIVILYEKGGLIRTHARIQMNKVEYHLQEKIIDYLDTKFEHPEVIGVDAGNEQGLIHHLLNDDAYVHKNYRKRLNDVKFGAWMVLGETPEGEEIKAKTKPYSVSLLQEYTNSHKFVYSSTDMELITEMERMTYTKTQTGDIVYKTLTPRGGKRGDDHFTAAMLCASLTYYLMKDSRLFRKVRPKLAVSRWVRG